MHRQLLSQSDGGRLGTEAVGGCVEAYSAGVETHGLNPNAVRVMAEAGVDIAGHRSKLVDGLMDTEFDLVIFGSVSLGSGLRLATRSSYARRHHTSSRARPAHNRLIHADGLTSAGDESVRH